MNLDSGRSTGQARRRGYCPGVWTPMASGDGLIVRVRAGVRPLTASTLRAVVALARAHGSGQLEITRRANLQLRGVSEQALAPLQEALVGLGLADPEPARERRRALLLSDPLASLASAGAHDPAELAHALEDALADADLPPALPAKLSVVLSAGSAALVGLAADVQLAPSPRDREHVEVRVGVTSAGESAWAFACHRGDAAHVVVRLLETFLRARSDDQRSVRALVQAAGVSALRDAVSTFVHASDAPPPLRPARPHGASLIGFHEGAPPWLGLALPFGAAPAEAWEAIAALAERFGTGALRLSPTRALIVPGVSASARAAVTQLARARALIVDPRDPLLAVVACPGAPSCGAALGDTRALARALAEVVAPTLARGDILHVSGCDKGCAQSGPAAITLVRAQGGCKLGYGKDVAQTAAEPVLACETARARLAASARDDKVRASMTRHYDYERDAAAIYRRSFAIIRAEAELARFAPIEERVAVRLIHTSGMVELADDILFSPGFAEAGARALAAGAPILCDTKMVASGVTRARLPADNDVLCFVDHPSVPELARAQGTTRSAAALSLWGERLDGALVAIGNAPTALFRLLELLDETRARPAAVIGLPVGFVGAAESKEALLADGRLPAMIVRGRKGGSAMTAAAINALASEKE